MKVAALTELACDSSVCYKTGYAIAGRVLGI